MFFLVFVCFYFQFSLLLSDLEGFKDVVNDRALSFSSIFVVVVEVSFGIVPNLKIFVEGEIESVVVVVLFLFIVVVVVDFFSRSIIVVVVVVVVGLFSRNVGVSFLGNFPEFASTFSDSVLKFFSLEFRISQENLLFDSLSVILKIDHVRVERSFGFVFVFGSVLCSLLRFLLIRRIDGVVVVVGRLSGGLLVNLENVAMIFLKSPRRFMDGAHMFVLKLVNDIFTKVSGALRAFLSIR